MVLGLIAFVHGQDLALYIVIMICMIVSVATEFEIGRILERSPRILYIATAVALFTLLFGHICFIILSEYFR